MDQEQKVITQQLLQELNELHFEGHHQVIKQTHPTSWKQRLAARWNKEIELPLLPSSMVLALFIIALIYIQGQAKHQDEIVIASNQPKLIEEGGNTYWEDLYQKAVVRIENQSKN